MVSKAIIPDGCYIFIAVFIYWDILRKIIAVGIIANGFLFYAN